MDSEKVAMPIWVTIIISALAGVLAGCFLFPVFTVILSVWENGDYRPLYFRYWFIETLTSPILALYILPLCAPITAIACFVGVIFQKSIYRHLMLWCLIAPVLVWLFVISCLAISPVNDFYRQFTWFERFLIYIPNPENFLFLIAPVFSSCIFYKMSAKKEKQ